METGIKELNANGTLPDDLKDYANEPLYFVSAYKHVFTYKSKDGSLVVDFMVDYRKELKAVEILNECVYIDGYYYFRDIDKHS